MKQLVQRMTSLLAVAALMPGMPLAAEQTMELGASGRTQLPPNTREVELVRQVAGSCRFGRTWGYDLGARDLWTQGCAGTFKVITHDVSQGVAPDSSNTGAALAAAAAIAGVAVLASRGRKHEEQSNSQPTYYPPQNSPAYYPPQSGYYPQPAGYYPQGGGRQGAIHGPGGLCLDMRGDRVQQGTEAIVYQCHGQKNQRFNWTPRGELIVANMCLDISGGSNANGARVIAWPCNGGRNQQWFVTGSQIRSQQNGKCVDVAGGGTAAGTPVIMYDCHGGPNQTWFW